jgi:hypothetical protein
LEYAVGQLDTNAERGGGNAPHGRTTQAIP